MTHFEPRTVERTDLPDAVGALGVDGEGRTHYTTTAVGGLTVYVETGEGYDAFDLEETPCGGLVDWIDHAGTLRGWNRLCYAEDFGQHLADTLADAAQQEAAD
jgi:hypothetical protein